MQRFIYITLLASCLGCVCGICVIDNKWGWSLECGIRDSYLFRIKDYGGVRANFDFGFGVGNEKGFPHSITNTKKAAHYRKKDYTARSSDVTLEGAEGEVNRQGDRRRAGSWLPVRLRPPPVNVQPQADGNQFPAQSRQSVGHTSLEQTFSGPQNRESEFTSKLTLGQSNPLVYSGEQGTIQSSPPESVNPVAFVAAERRTPVAIVSAEKESPIRVVSVDRGSPVSLPSYERSIPTAQVQKPVQHRRYQWRGQNHRNRTPQPPSIAQNLLSWLPWPFNYWATTPAPTPAVDPAPILVSVPAPSRVAGGSRAVGAFDRSTSNFRVIHNDGIGQFSAPTRTVIPANQGNQINQPVQFLAPPLQIHRPSHQPHQPQHHVPTSSPLPTVGPEIAEVLKVNADTPADTDHVPSFAARMFVVRQAPQDFHPPGYTPDPEELKGDSVELPRTNFFCEEHKYLPGIYADTQLGCKVFHLCVPAAMGNTLTSFLCPNMTLFDQSVLQCNWWYHVRCEDSHKHYDANLPMAISYRRINAAQLPLSAVNNLNSVSLLEHNANGFGSRISRALELRSVNIDVTVNNEKEDLKMTNAEEDSTEFPSKVDTEHQNSTEELEQVGQNSGNESAQFNSSDISAQHSQNSVNETGNLSQESSDDSKVISQNSSHETEHLHKNSKDESKQFHENSNDEPELQEDTSIGLPELSPFQDTNAVMKRFFSLLEIANNN
ncbi:hypothetical protein Pcinc_028872 [Petrolisthes cinctipes]|uniref:Chitin-binding type-2 domain-containing protein n=1 Tax=Petrolisthes cinctipes TaxID=88211 RepID=A0AAE1F2U6_PETCI|nr:hypothetical protein Pcinc_028872 [Petrolisthes cinctipes]